MIVNLMVMVYDHWKDQKRCEYCGQFVDRSWLSIAKKFNSGMYASKTPRKCERCKVYELYEGLDEDDKICVIDRMLGITEE